MSKHSIILVMILTLMLLVVFNKVEELKNNDKLILANQVKIQVLLDSRTSRFEKIENNIEKIESIENAIHGGYKDMIK